ncbi:phosphoglycerate mutase-like protein [Hypoxylon rubiginosum]|uniref:Phosphoglycerate mutase-like protein n=1 Tax=Hypoxylon rubiginosum TaxID=110542 RepID=A0ACC0CYV7_9PEZI|nr:phosphoglycerate mutase-like protein [Hypoxylon rubiginosum]
MAPVIDIIRHAESYHNLFGPHVRDPGITPIGGEQDCAALRKKYPYADDVIFIIASPMRRCIETALKGIAPLLDEGQGIISLLPDLQEVNASPSGTGSPLSRIIDMYGEENIEKATVPEDWYLKGPDTRNAPDPAKVQARARSARHSIRNATRIAARHNPDAHTVVVTHGEFAHWLTDDFAGMTNTRNSAWWNCEVRSYRFADLENRDDDDDATLIEIDTPASLERRDSYLPAADTEERKRLQKQIAVLHVLGHGRMADMWAGQELEENA